MRQDRFTRAVSTGPALLLLLLVTAGLFTMHTLGHAGPHDPSMHSHEMVAAGPMPAAPDPIAAPHAQNQIGDQAPDGPLPFESLAVCMAVLSTVVLLVIVALLFGRTSQWIIRLTRPVRRAVDMVRGPPGSPIGLLIADLSVARN